MYAKFVLSESDIDDAICYFLRNRYKLSGEVTDFTIEVDDDGFFVEVECDCDMRDM